MIPNQLKQKNNNIVRTIQKFYNLEQYNKNNTKKNLELTTIGPPINLTIRNSKKMAPILTRNIYVGSKEPSAIQWGSTWGYL